MDGALTLPDGRPAGLDPVTTPAEARALVASTCAHVDRLAASGDAVEAAIGRLLSQHGAGSGEAAAWIDGASDGADLYRGARAALDGGQPGQALALLAALAEVPSGRADALLGLAVCAVRLGCHEDGRVLALASQDLLPDHPRPRTLLGLCELELGNRRAAQASLAAAARIARRDPAHRDDLHTAQRTLLLMHLG